MQMINELQMLKWEFKQKEVGILTTFGCQLTTLSNKMTSIISALFCSRCAKPACRKTTVHFAQVVEIVDC